MPTIQNRITGASTDQEIFLAIREASKHRYPWRKHDWPKGGRGPSWVMTSDVGLTNRGDRSLIQRLKQMVAEGKLVSRTYSGRSVHIRDVVERGSRHYDGTPRFRIKRHILKTLAS